MSKIVGKWFIGDSGDPNSATRLPLDEKRLLLEPEFPTPISGESKPEKKEPGKLGEFWPEVNTLPVGHKLKEDSET